MNVASSHLAWSSGVRACNIHPNDGVSSLQLSPLASSLVAIASTNESMMKMKLMKTVKKLGV